MDINTIIITTLRLCKTVAVAESEYFMALIKAYWHNKSPKMAKAKSQARSFGTVQIFKTLSFSLKDSKSNSKIPDKTILIAVTQDESIS